MAQDFLTVIIPTLDEAELLPALLQDLAKQQEVNLEIIVADGGSTDTTAAIAAAFSARVVRSKKGRGAQMNGAAAAAAGAYLLFLHADSRLDDPKLLGDALRALRTEAAGEQQIAGHFSLHFLRTEPRNSRAYRYAEEKSAFNRVNTTNGDQGLLLCKEFFHQLGGFDASLPFLEDQRLAEKIRAQGRWITLPGYLQTSARRFEREGFHRRYILMSIMMGLHSIGEEGFLVRAPGIYRVQEETEKLRLSPFFALCRRMIAAWGVGGSIRIFYRLGRYIRSHSWQVFFFFDVCLRPYLGAGRYPFLSFHDRTSRRWVDCKLGDAATGGLCFIWLFGILAPYFWLQEHFDSPAAVRAKVKVAPH